MMIATDARDLGQLGSRAGVRPRASRIAAKASLASRALGEPQTSMISASLCFRSSSILCDVLVGELLDALLGAALLVVADVAVVDELLQVVHHVAADVAHGDAALLGQVADDLDELLAPLLGQLRDRQADDLAVVRRA